MQYMARQLLQCSVAYHNGAEWQPQIFQTSIPIRLPTGKKQSYGYNPQKTKHPPCEKRASGFSGMEWWNGMVEWNGTLVNSIGGHLFIKTVLL